MGPWPNCRSTGDIWRVRASAHCTPTGWRSGRRPGRVPTAGDFPNRFTIDLAGARVTCPAQQVAPIPHGAATVHFAAATCAPCALRAACTTATRAGRSLALHPQEALLQGLRAAHHHPPGRARLRERTTVEHALARIDQIQGATARYKGARKNTLDLRRVAVVANLQRIARLPKAA